MRGRLDLLVELGCAQTLRELVSDLTALAALDARGVIVTASGEIGGDFVSRFFAPAVAHCSLGAYWSKRLRKTRLTGLQVSTRGGRIEVHLRDGRVALTGQAVTVTRGELAI